MCHWRGEAFSNPVLINASESLECGAADAAGFVCGPAASVARHVAASASRPDEKVRRDTVWSSRFFWGMNSSSPVQGTAITNIRGEFGFPPHYHLFPSSGTPGEGREGVFSTG